MMLDMKTNTARGIKMVAKFAGTCWQCKVRFPAGADIVYYKDLARHARTWHPECGREEALRRASFAAGLKALGGLDEQHWIDLEKRYEAERAELRVIIDARVAAAAEAGQLVAA